MDILKHALPIKSLIFFKLNCHAKMAPDSVQGQVSKSKRSKATATSSTQGSLVRNPSVPPVAIGYLEVGRLVMGRRVFANGGRRTNGPKIARRRT